MNACPMNRAIDLHFAGRITPELEHDLRIHLPTCDLCRAYYERHLVLSGLDPNAQQPEERIGRGLGLKKRSKGLFEGALMLTAATAALLVLFMLPEEPPETEVQIADVQNYMEHNDPLKEYRARGGDSDKSSRVLAYRRPPVGKPSPLDNEISAEDDLAFAYENGHRWQRLLIFATDEADKVYWYYPEWTEQAANPIAISIQSTGGVHELPYSVHHNFEGSWLMVYTIFTDKAVTVRDVEGLLKGERTAGQSLLPDSQEQTLLVRVKRK